MLKPAIGATSEGLIRVRSKADLKLSLEMALLSGRDYLAQPFQREILDGEISLHFFDKKYSHAAIKRPKSGDFRVQEAFGGISGHYIAMADEVAFAREVMARVDGDVLVARVDLIRTAAGFRLMELELIEPYLFLGTDPEHAPVNFADALERAVSLRTT